MPSVEMNKKIWDGDYHWSESGDEWSSAWGGVDMQWYGAILPRLHRFLPADSILEIAPGFGRWSQFLKDSCRELTLVDLSEKCITACRERFSGAMNIRYHVNDGKTLDMIPDDSVDFAFSFDSLVHVDAEVIRAYVAGLSRKLTRNGVAFIHHSNAGEYAYYWRFDQVPLIKRMLGRLGIIERDFHWRSFRMTAGKMESFARESGLVCVSQEVIPWLTRRAHIDCLSVLTGKDSRWARENRVWRNKVFMREAGYWREASALYGYRPETEC